MKYERADPKDFIAPPCQCGSCVQAGVHTLDSRRDPWSGKWLHGYELKRWYEARAKARAALRSHPAKGMK